MEGYCQGGGGVGWGEGLREEGHFRVVGDGHVFELEGRGGGDFEEHEAAVVGEAVGGEGGGGEGDAWGQGGLVMMI